jgi:hypothetical protein
MAAFARAAAGFLEASGWRHLNEEDRVRIEAPEVEANLRCFILDHLGGRTAPDLNFFPDPPESLPDPEILSLEEDLPDAEADDEPWEEDWEDWDGDDPWDDEVWTINFLKPWVAPEEDADLWEKHGLPRRPGSRSRIRGRAFRAGDGRRGTGSRP